MPGQALPATLTPHIGEQPNSGAAQRHASTVAIFAVPLLAVLIVATRYNRTSYFYDEWSMLQRVLTTRSNVINGATLGYNGHLYVVCYFVYKAQLALGLSNHALIWIVFCASLVALTVATTLVLRAGEVPLLPALAAAVVITYFGPGAQLMTFEFQFTMNAALACSLLAGFCLLTAKHRRRSSLYIAALLLLAVVLDSATAFAGGLFIAMLMLLRQRDRWAIIALAPSAFLGALFTFVSHNALLAAPATINQRLAFAAHLTLLALGGIAGGGQIVGALMLVLTVSALGWSLRAQRLPRSTRDLVVAATVSALAMIAITTWSRAGLVRGDFFDFNRYISLVAIYCLLAVLPLAFRVLLSIPAVTARTASMLLALLLTVVFILNARPLTHYRATIEMWMAQTHALVAEATWTMSASCSHSASLNYTATPLGSVGPQVTVALLYRLEHYGALTPPRQPPVRPPVVSAAQWQNASDVCTSRPATLHSGK